MRNFLKEIVFMKQNKVSVDHCAQADARWAKTTGKMIFLNRTAAISFYDYLAYFELILHLFLSLVDFFIFSILKAF